MRSEGHHPHSPTPGAPVIVAGSPGRVVGDRVQVYSGEDVQNVSLDDVRLDLSQSYVRLLAVARLGPSGDLADKVAQQGTDLEVQYPARVLAGAPGEHPWVSTPVR